MHLLRLLNKPTTTTTTITTTVEEGPFFVLDFPPPPPLFPNKDKKFMASRSARISSSTDDASSTSSKDSIRSYFGKMNCSLDGGDRAGKMVEGLRWVCRRFRKGRSAAVASVRSPPLLTVSAAEEDGIRDAIAHCKLSFNRGGVSPLMRSRSDPGNRLWKEPCMILS